jgi:phage terminase small subunit
MPILSNIHHEAFCQAICQNTTEIEAYKLAGYKPKNQKSAVACASRLLTNVKVQARVHEIRQTILAKNDVTTTRILRELAAIAFANPKRVMKWGTNVISVEENDDDGSAQVRMVVKNELLVINSSELDDEVAAAIQEVRRHADGSITVKFHPKLPALVKLGEHMGLFSGESAESRPRTAITLR